MRPMPRLALLFRALSVQVVSIPIFYADPTATLRCTTDPTETGALYRRRRIR